LLFQLHTHEVVEVCAKILYQVELQRGTLEQMWGFSVEAELIENAERQDELCCYVSRVEDKSVAMQNGELCCRDYEWIFSSGCFSTPT
jgi:T-lymphoma invasion and metastasis-inducing protein 1